MLGRRNIKTLELKLGIGCEACKGKIMLSRLEIVKAEQNSMLLSWEWLKSQVKTLNLTHFAGSHYFSELLLRSGGLAPRSGKAQH